jgi:hypothetical protein
LILRSRRRIAATFAAACLIAAGCTVRLANQVRYAGTLGECDDGTGRTAQASLVRVSDHFSFAPQDGVLIITGPVAEDGTFSGSLAPAASRRDSGSRSDSRPNPAVLTVEGHLDDDTATGVYVSPRCRAAFRLPRIRPDLLP